MENICNFINDNPAEELNCTRQKFEETLIWTRVHNEAHPIKVYEYNGHLVAWYDPELKWGFIA